MSPQYKTLITFFRGGGCKSLSLDSIAAVKNRIMCKKYLKVYFEFVSVGPIETRDVCQERNETLSCPSGTGLHILSASYGRLDAKTCAKNISDYGPLFASGLLENCTVQDWTSYIESL